MDQVDWDDNDDFDDDYEEPDQERDEWVLDCGYEGCCMPGYHFRSECHNAADMEAMYAEHEQQGCTCAFGNGAMFHLEGCPLRLHVSEPGSPNV